MRKPLGEKRKYLTADNIAQIARIYGDFTEDEHSKIFDTCEFGFHEVTVERPLRLNTRTNRATLGADPVQESGHLEETQRTRP